MISVIVPLYNYGNVLRRAVQSVFAQTHQDFEVIVVDDGSTDGSGAVADALTAEYGPKLRVIHQENQGLSAALNAGLRVANGSEFVILSADDELVSRHLGTTLQEMQRTGADIVSSHMIAGKRVVACVPGSLERLKRSNCHHYAALVRIEWFKRAGGFKTTMNPSWEDYEFWLHCAKLGAKWAHVDAPLFNYHPTTAGRDAQSQGKDRLLRGKLEGYHQDVFGKGRGVVAVIIPLYEQEEYVEHAVKSVTAQVYPHVVPVVVSDASPKTSRAVTKRLKNLGCDVLTHDKNRGLAATRNTGISYAYNKYHMQYFVCLDADDGLKPEFVEEAMAAMLPYTYVYPDVQFIGDAWHTYDLKAFNCKELATTHQHPCAFLAETRMWLDILNKRGYGYDEGDTLRTGYEDWEFALACVEEGWCGKHLAKKLFEYYFHKNGSMRTRAQKQNKKDGVLKDYIARTHPWTETLEGREMACSTCGGGAGKFTGVKVTGRTVQAGEPLKVTYTGSANGALTRTGLSGTIYRPSASNRVIFIDARDAHLFTGGPFRIEDVPKNVDQVVADIAAATAEKNILKTVADRVAFAEVAQQMEQRFQADTARKDDLTMLPGVGAKRVKMLVEAGLSRYEDIAKATDAELDKILSTKSGVNVDVKEIRAHARLLAQHRSPS
jgi:glycosyltransferase involved in cell wall biosynthesis/predicted flap endonuclease-1-like 5' DNA nuclease